MPKHWGETKRAMPSAWVFGRLAKGACLGMGLTGLLADWVPALRAARVLPAEVLRSE